jgi:hypothetical protein
MDPKVARMDSKMSDRSAMHAVAHALDEPEGEHDSNERADSPNQTPNESALVPIAHAPNGDPLYLPKTGRGALRRGGKKGNAGGRNIALKIRKAMLSDLASTQHVLREHAEGKMRVPLVETCPKCGYEPASAQDANADMQRFIEMRVPIRDQQRAVKTLAEFTIGTVNGVSLEALQERLEETQRVIRENTTPEEFAIIDPLLLKVWQ